MAARQAARVALAERLWGPIRRDGLSARLGAHWEGELKAFVRWLSFLLRSHCHVDNLRDGLANARGKVKWLRIQERWNPEVVIMFGTAAFYHRATAGSSHNDVHPDKPTPHTGAVRPHPGFMGSLLLFRDNFFNLASVAELYRRRSPFCSLFAV